MDENQELNQEQQEQQDEPRFTQADLDAMFNKGFAKGKKGAPSDEELSEFRAWKDSQRTPEEKEAHTQAEIDSALAEAEMVRRENWLLKNGVDPEFADIYAIKISRMMDGETEFEEAAKKFLKEHKQRPGVRVDMSGRLTGGNGGKKTANDAMNDLIRAAKR